ncbi:MAG: hypothetical protein AB1472_05100 [Candidatus Omnitrophota bacterium]
MNFIKKLLIILFIILLFSGFYLFLTKDRIVKAIIINRVSYFVGAKVDIDRFSFNLMNSNVEIEGLKIYNPGGFPQGIMADIPLINIEYDLSALLKKQLHFALVEFELKELLIIKNKDGKTNVDSLKFIKEGKEIDLKALSLHIEMLKLSIGKLVKKDFSLSDRPLPEIKDINIKKIYKNVTSFNQLAMLILADSLGSTFLKGMETYGIYALATTYIIPIKITTSLIAKDSIEASFNADFNNVYEISLKAMDRVGEIIKQDRKLGVIKGKIHSVDIIIRILQREKDKINIIIAARKMMFPKPNIAESILYEISERLK